MKTALLGLFLGLVTASGQWDVASTLPTCYTGLPFNIRIGGASSNDYSYSASNLPSWASLNPKNGVITGSSQQTGAWPIEVKVVDSNQNSINRQYLINVVDTSAQNNQVWASTSTTNYYDRPVNHPLRVVPSSSDPTAVSCGDQFRYTFKSENSVGSPVWAFLNLPNGLTGNTTTGTISGSFTVPGIYTIGVSSGDQSGNTAEGFVTISVEGTGSGSGTGSTSGTSGPTSGSGSTTGAINGSGTGSTSGSPTGTTNGNGNGSGKSNGNGNGSGNSVAQISTLNKITVNNNVPFVYDIGSVQAQQTQADKQLFAALSALNSAKAEQSNRQGIYDSISVKLLTAQANADKAAAAAAQANTDRQNAANRLTQTNRALTDSEDKLNLALLYQAGAKDNVRKADGNLATAQSKFDNAQAALAAAEKALQDAQTVLNNKKSAEAQANTALQNALKDYKRANEDFNEAKAKLNEAQEAQQGAQDALTKAQNDLSLAQQAYDTAKHQLQQASIQQANAYAAQQAALKVLQDAIAANQLTLNNLGAAEWNLNQAIAALNVANAAKDAADRTSALVIANGTPQSPSTTTAKVDVTATFKNCQGNGLPSYSGAVKVSQVYSDRAVLVTGNTILFGSCTKGANNIVQGSTINIIGSINPSSKCIEVHTASPAKLS